MNVWLWDTFRRAAWAPITVFIFYAIAAKLLNAYILYPWLDMPTHLFGGMAITYFFAVGLAQSQSHIGEILKPIRIALSLGLTAITAVIWEFLEYFSDVLLDTKMNLGVSDTLSDLFFGLLGGVIAVALASWSGSIDARGVVDEA